MNREDLYGLITFMSIAVNGQLLYWAWLRSFLVAGLTHPELDMGFFDLIFYAIGASTIATPIVMWRLTKYVEQHTGAIKA